jgi:hypothetical protein
MRTEVTHSVKNAHKNFLCPADTVLQLEKVTEGGLEVIFSGQLSSGPSLPVIRPFPTKFGGLRVQAHIGTHVIKEVLKGDVNIDLNILCCLVINWDTNCNPAD